MIGEGSFLGGFFGEGERGGMGRFFLGGSEEEGGRGFWGFLGGGFLGRERGG